jgi:signal peptidase I
MEELRLLFITTAVLTTIALAVVVPIAASMAAARQCAALAAAGESAGVPAGLWIRVAAWYADTLVLNLLTVVLLVVAAVIDAMGPASLAIWAGAIAMPVVLFVLYVTNATAARGSTWGKRLAGVKVTRLDGTRCGWGCALLRTCVLCVMLGVLTAAGAALEALLTALSPRRRAPHDVVAGSAVEAYAAPSRALPWVAAGAVLAPLVVVFGLLRPLAVQAFYLPSGSMAPTLVQGDRVLANKLAYRLGSVRRGDLVVFEAPAAAILSPGQHQQMIKRVVGIPGDRIRIRQNVGVYLNGKLSSDPPGVSGPDYDWPVDDYGKLSGTPYTVPPGGYFVLGDNRNASYDSHAWTDPTTRQPRPALPQSSLCGRVTLRFWPLSRVALVR